MDAVLSFLHEKGFFPPDFTPDGSLHRFGRNGSKDSAWYVAWSNAHIKTGKFYYVASFGDWKTGENYVYKPDKLTRVENKAIVAQIAEKQAAVKKERERVQLATAGLAEKRFNAATKTGSTPYMARKLIPDLYGCCLYQDRLQVPMRDVGGKLWSLQTIFPNGDKKFMGGGRKKGCFHVIGAPIGGDPIYLAEGFATAASIHQAVGATVVCAFDAGNLVEVAAALAAAYPCLEIRVCGDDDRKNPENPGRTKAEKAALLTSGISLFPTFVDDEGSDFNDIHVRHGLAALRDQLVAKPPERKTGFVPLGYHESVHYFYNIPSKDIVKATTFSPVQMYHIAPMEYWEAVYPTKKGGADLHKASHDLVQTSMAVGPFDATRVRGTGVWLDKGRVVINTGHSLIVDKKEIPLTAIESHYLYIQTINRMPPIHPNPLTASQGAELSNICRMFHWQNEGSGLLLAGWLTIARIAGALPVRPHIWITGSKATGKSTLMEKFIGPSLGSTKGKMHLLGSTTEAGIRQALRASSLPIIFDEFESTGKTSKERIESILELLRNAWSTSQGKILKGSAGGISVEFQLHFAALLSSIRVKLDNDADRSRFAVLELKPHGDDPLEWSELNTHLGKITEDVGERLFARACHLVPEILACQKILEPALAKVRNQRYAQQMGALLSGAWMLQRDQVITESEAAVLAKTFVDYEADEHGAEEMSDEDECLTRLLTWKLDLRDHKSLVVMSLADAIKEPYWRDFLTAYGVKIRGDSFVVANNHTELEKHYRDSRWANNWARALKRLKNAQPCFASFGSRSNKGRAIAIPLDLV